MAPSFHVWLQIYGFHSIILVVLYQNLVVYSGYHVVSDLRSLSIRRPSIYPNHMMQRGCSISKEEFSQLVHEVKDLRI